MELTFFCLPTLEVLATLSPHSSPSLEALPSGCPPPVLAPTLAEHSLFSLALGAQRARLSPLVRWQHLLLHWALFRQSSPSSCGGSHQGALPWLAHPPEEGRCGAGRQPGLGQDTPFQHWLFHHFPG